MAMHCSTCVRPFGVKVEFRTSISVIHPREVSVCLLTAFTVCSAQGACAKCITSGLRKKAIIFARFHQTDVFFDHLCAM